MTAAGVATATIYEVSKSEIKQLEQTLNDSDPLSSPFVFAKGGKTKGETTANLSELENQALLNKKAGKAYDKKAAKSAKEKIKTAEKHAGTRHSSQKK